MAQAQHLALVQPVTDIPKFEGVVLPYKPPIDKIAAIVILQAHNEGPLQILEYWKRNDCPPEMFAKWRDRRLYPVDAGDRKYHKAGVGSASEFVVKHFGIELSAGGEKLLEMINRNNKTGYLKEHALAVPHLLREMYELSDREEDHIDIINHASDVISSYVAVENGEMHQPLDGFDEALPQLVEQLAACKYAPMTLGRYARDRWILGDTPAEIVEKIAFWTDGLARLQKELERGKVAFDALNPKDWFLAKGYKGIVLRTNDRFLVKAATKSGQYAIRVIVDGSGNTTISTSGLDLSAIAEQLRQMEPDLWYYQAQMGALINGGPQYVGTPPTRLKPSRLVGMIQQYVAHKKKR